MSDLQFVSSIVLALSPLAQKLSPYFFFRGKTKRNTYQENEMMVFCLQHCSYLLWEKMFYWSRKTFEIQDWKLRISNNFEIAIVIYLNIERSEEFLKQNTSLFNFYRRYLRSNRLEPLEFKFGWDHNKA